LEGAQRQKQRRPAARKEHYGRFMFTAYNKGSDAAGGKTALGLRQMFVV
jgi:hypothetical protein